MAESRFLRSLAPELFERLKPDLQTLHLERNFEVMRIGEPAEYVFFPTDCLISIVVVMENGDMIEAITVGNDGLVGVSAFLGVGLAQATGMVQIPGEAMRMSASAFRKHLDDPDFRRSVGNFASLKFSLVAQSAACVAFHLIHERLARWLLQVRDGLERSEFALTQDFLAMMLGVHRPTVTIAFHVLEDEGFVEHHHGVIRIIDGDGLATAACECYATARRRASIST